MLKINKMPTHLFNENGVKCIFNKKSRLNSYKDRICKNIDRRNNLSYKRVKGVRRFRKKT